MGDLKFNEVHPVLKWVGGKTQLLSDIRLKYPQGVDRFCEPMVGAGAVLLDVITKFHPKEVMINDINKDLMNVYVQIRDNVAELISVLNTYQGLFNSSTDDERKDLYNQIRDEFNELKVSGNDNVKKAALFIYLNKTCFNGLYRVNKKGLFNVPVGRYSHVVICDQTNLCLVSKLLQNVEIICGDYHECADFINQDTFVYIDPPYRPLTKTSCFTAYHQNNFDDEQQIELANFVKNISNKGAKVLLSNSDPTNVNPSDRFFFDLYKGYTIEQVLAKRSVNCKSSKRGCIRELLISNY
jgi:DNA adenine methylase